jgi:hypothetical protein
MKNFSDKTKIKVFISHQWRDKQIADRLARDLEGFADVWMDFRNLRPGDRIQETIDDVLKGVDIVALIWTKNAQKSSGVKAEIDTCLNIGARIIPCFFEYDDDGNSIPPLDKPLDQILGVDFHHYGSGVAQLTEFILGLQVERLPKEAAMDEHPGMRMLKYLRGYLNYLANYRNLRDVKDQRAEWISKIIDEIEKYLHAGGDKNQVRMLLESAYQNEVNDPEGIGMLITRLEPLLGSTPPGRQIEPSNVQLLNQAQNQTFQWTKPPKPPVDHLANRIAELAPAGTAEDWQSKVDNYINSAMVTLEALTSYAQSLGSPAGIQVVIYLQNYLNNADDLIPDHQGKYGLLDDAWLILNTAFRLIESGLLPANSIPVDWKSIVQTDYMVRSIIPQEAVSVLTTIVFQMLQVIADEVDSYQPWFTPQDHGYMPTMARPSSAGGTWEDQMNSALLGTGLSV